jgi:hypothetical protein
VYYKRCTIHVECINARSLTHVRTPALSGCFSVHFAVFYCFFSPLFVFIFSEIGPGSIPCLTGTLRAGHIVIRSFTRNKRQTFNWAIFHDPPPSLLVSALNSCNSNLQYLAGCRSVLSGNFPTLRANSLFQAPFYTGCSVLIQLIM